MGPGLGISTSLGAYDPPIPDPYANERTLFDRDRVLAISAESKLGDNSPPVERTLTDLALSPDQIDTLRALPSSDGVTLDPDLIGANSDLLNGTGESSLYDAIANRQGQTDCK